MISAKDALALSNTDEIEVERMLAQINQKVRDAAMKGLRTFEIKEIGWITSSDFWWNTQPSKKITLAVAALESYGYKVTWGPVGKPYVPMGLRDPIDGGGPEYKNLAITINW